jgi:hypothetical protein
VPGFGGRGLGEVEGCERVDPVLHVLHEFLQLLVHREIRQSAKRNKNKIKKTTLFAVIGFGSTPIPLLDIIGQPLPATQRLRGRARGGHYCWVTVLRIRIREPVLL